MFFVSLVFFLFFLCIVLTISIDGPRPTWQPAIISYHISDMCYSIMANKIVVVVVLPARLPLRGATARRN